MHVNFDIPFIPIVYLNGKFLPVNQAQVSVLDRGFLFGDGVYEVIPVYGGYPFRLAEHLRRLNHSLTSIRCDNPLNSKQWSDLFIDLVTRNGGGDLSVYLQVTRGVGLNRDHAFPVGVLPSVFMMATPLLPLPEEKRRKGVSAILVDDIRWKHCDLKVISLLPNVLFRQQAIDVAAFDAIFVRDGQVTEGAVSNVFVVHDGKVVTPSKGPLLLPGITRDLVLELAIAENIPAREGMLTMEDLYNADEIWLTSSTKEIVPVVILDSAPVGNGLPGTHYRRMMDLYQDFKKKARLSQLEDKQ
ncbi:D-alanine aminotransferase [Gammaproteobacteria bacterium]